MCEEGRLYSDHEMSVGEVPISEDSILLHESVIRGYHVFKEVWTPQLGEILVVSEEAGNVHDRRTVALDT